MQFSSVINQQQVKKQLADMVQQNRLSHALLFLSKEGSGSLSLALALAQYITCEKVNNKAQSSDNNLSLFGEEQQTPSDRVIQAGTNYKPQTANDSCGACPSCIKAAQLVHPDIHFSFPVVTKKTGTPPLSSDYIADWREFVLANPYGNVYDWLQHIGAENKQGNITANECNDIIRKLSLKSFESVYKVLVMWMPEYLGKEGNKLLKLIEEPPPDTLIILVAENESLLLPTIISRCQLIRIPGLDTDDIVNALTEKNNINEETARQIAITAEGNYRDALQMLRHAGEDWHGMLRDWLNSIIKTGPVAQTKWVEEISRAGRENQKQFLRYFNHLLEHSIRMSVTGDSDKLPEKEKDFARRLNKMAGIAQQQAMAEELDRAIYHIERNANAKILFHALTIRLYHIIQDKIVFLTD